MASAFIGLGSNVGDREKHLENAVAKLRETDGVDVTQVSSLYQTDAVGYTDQADFLNAVVEVDTSLTPRALLSVTKRIETELKRTRERHWGPRTIDLDILLYNDTTLAEPHLNLPHHEVRNRAFVLVPLVEIAPEKRLPSGERVTDLLRELGEIRGINVYRRPTDNVNYMGKARPN